MMNKELEALCYLDDIAHGRKMNLDAHELKLIVEKELKALEILKEFISIKEDDDDLFPYRLEFEPQYVSNRSCKVITKEKYEVLRKVLKEKLK